MIRINCKTCKKEFFIQPSQKNQGRKFCSRNCYHKGTLGQNNPNWKKIKTNCKFCGKELLVIPAAIKNGKGKYCSRDCMSRWYKENLRGEKCPAWKGGLVEKICFKCGKKFFGRHDFKCKFCSRECAGNLKKLTGNRNKGLGSDIRTSAKYKRWNQNILIRDKFICQKCKQNTGDLEVHHKKSFKVLLQEVKRYLPLFSLYDGAMLYAPLWDENNGITYCRKCHKKEVK